MNTATAEIALCGRPGDIEVILARMVAAGMLNPDHMPDPQRPEARIDPDYPDVQVRATLATDVPRPRGGTR